MFSHVALSDGVIASPETPLYLAPIASASNSGSDSAQTSSVSTTSPLVFFRYSARKELTIAVDTDRCPRGEATTFKRRIVLLLCTIFLSLLCSRQKLQQETADFIWLLLLNPMPGALDEL